MVLSNKRLKGFTMMKRNYKVVYTHERNNDEDLFDFYETIEEAEAAKPVLAEKYPR